MRAWATKPRNRRESGYGGSPELEDGKESATGAADDAEMFLPTVATRRPVLLAGDTPLKIGRPSAASPPAALTAVLEAISTRMEEAGDWESAAALSSSASVVAEVEHALNAASVKSTDVTASELLTALLSCFAE